MGNQGNVEKRLRARELRTAPSKTAGCVSMANTYPALIRILLVWLRRQFDIDEGRLRCKLHLHDGLDLAAVAEFWSDVTAIPVEQFRAPYRAVADGSRRHSEHRTGCATVMYSCTLTIAGCWR